MELNDKQFCNVCLVASSTDTKTVFIKAVCLGEDVHICTSCIPQVIHGSGEIIKSNAEVKEKVS